MSHGGPAMAALLEAWPDTQAMMCVSDMSAFGAIMECHRRGMTVPDDIVVAGFGNFEVSMCCTPTITTVSVDAYCIGLRTGAPLLTALQERDASAAYEIGRRVHVAYKVVARESA